MTPRPTDATAQRLTAIEKQLEDCTEDIAQKHKENRRDIHQIRTDHQSITNTLHSVEKGIAGLMTKLDTLYGTDGGRPGQVDELKKTIADNREAVKREMEAMEARIGVKIDAVRAEMKLENASLKAEFAAQGKEVAKELRGYGLKFMFLCGAFMAIAWIIGHGEFVMRLLGGK